MKQTTVIKNLVRQRFITKCQVLQSVTVITKSDVTDAALKRFRMVITTFLGYIGIIDVEATHL